MIFLLIVVDKGKTIKNLFFEMQDFDCNSLRTTPGYKRILFIEIGVTTLYRSTEDNSVSSLLKELSTWSIISSSGGVSSVLSDLNVRKNICISKNDVLAKLKKP